ncbi:hypothetical protein IX55_06050 [Paracoccus sanguinis]|nr:hypothetical protein IX55_06050 [Paracoccus sanguinis]
MIVKRFAEERGSRHAVTDVNRQLGGGLDVRTQPAWIERHIETVSAIAYTRGFQILAVEIGNDIPGNDLITDQDIDCDRRVAAWPPHPSVDPDAIGEVDGPLR